MSQVRNYITPQGIEALRSEYEQLVKIERPKTVETVAWAAGNGDRSENGDYIYGKRRLREIDRRLRYLGKKIESAHIVNPLEMQTDKVAFSATVSVEYEDGSHKIFQIVGEDEIDAVGCKISWKSPMAKSLLGKKIDDEVLIPRPKGDTWVVITKVEYL